MFGWNYRGGIRGYGDVSLRRKWKKHLRRERESAKLSFGADNLKLICCNFKLSASATAGISPSFDGFKLHNELPIILVIRKQEVNTYVTRRKGESKN